MSSLTVEEAVEEAMAIDIDIHNDINIEVAETNHGTFFTAQCLKSICNLATICGNLVMVLFGAGPAVFGEEAAAAAAAAPDTRCPLSFTIICLLAFVGIKSHGDTSFPFQTHPWTIMVSVTSLLLYSFSSIAEQYVSVARAGRAICLFILVASLASMFYF